ncbi:helix-turn-helix transcriptional regulator [Streptomyces sp. A7024]|uniref:Helix-turn-helix transcriptional regulator n=1 Tax=Streptomyces coryli TaxID=1128680 RepID=A0A6G4U622_9ACTN|nr:helix-turn-helix transcriptional regulator [Streptomyces coryli]NGN67624.1 helix-turn-helix transcriptional regulator [Streptomyces coryli]
MPDEKTAQLYNAVDELLTQSVVLPPPGERKRLREAHGLRQEDVATALHVRRATVGAWESENPRTQADPRGAERKAYARLLAKLAELYPPQAASAPEVPPQALTEAPVQPAPPPAAAEEAPAAGPAGPAGPCVLCGRPATDVVEGFTQHLDPADCTPTAPQPPPAGRAAVPVVSPGPEPAAAPPEPPEAPAVRPVSHPPRQSASQRTKSAGSGSELPVDEIHQVVVAEATKAGGDMEAATAALVKRAIPDAMALWHLTRVASRYDVLFRPPRPDILKKRSKQGADEIWEARPKWRNTALLKDKASPPREVTVLDMNGAYLAALKAHLPHKMLEHDTSGAYDRRRSGVYLITPPEWTHADLPNPIGNRDTPGELWVTDATLRLLLRASGPRYELCAPPVIHESWTAAGSESLLEKFRATLAAVREEALANNDAMTLEYVKSMYSKFVSTCGESSHNRDIERPEWMHIIHSQAFANLWWKAYKAHEAGLAVVQMAGTDELHVTGGDWRQVFDEGRGLAEVKVKDTYTIGGTTAGGGR